MRARTFVGVTSQVVVQHEDKPPLAKLDSDVRRALRRGSGRAAASPLEMLSRRWPPHTLLQGPLEEHEQEQVLEAFEDMQLSSARTWRATFGSGALLLAGFWLWSAWQEQAHPWGQRITGRALLSREQNLCPRAHHNGATTTIVGARNAGKRCPRRRAAGVGGAL